MTAEIPEYVDAENYVDVWFLPEAEDLAAITLAEHAAGVHLGMYLPQVWEGMTAEQARTQQTRMALGEGFETLGRVTRSLAEFRGTYLPQEAPEHVGNKAKTMMAQGTRGVIFIRYGKHVEEPVEAADNYDAVRCLTGVQVKLTTATEEGGPLVYSQSVSSQGGVVEGSVVAL